RGGSQNLSLPEPGFVVGQSGASGLHIFAAIAALEFFERGLRLVVTGFGGGDLLGPVAAVQLIQPLLGALSLRQGHFPVGLGRVALLLGNLFLCRKRIITLKIKMRARLVGGRAVQIGPRGIDVLLAVPICSLVVFRLGLGRGRACFLYIFFAVAVFGFFGGGARLLQGCLQFLIVER